MAERRTQSDLADLQAGDECLREGASRVADASEIEEGDLTFSHEAWEQLKRVPPLVKRKSEMSPFEAAQDTTKALREDYFGTNKTFRSFLRRLFPIWRSLLTFYIRTACRYIAVRLFKHRSA